MASANVETPQLSSLPKEQLQPSHVMDPETRRRKRAIAVSMLSRALAMLQSSSELQQAYKKPKLALPVSVSKQHTQVQLKASLSISSSKRAEQRPIKIADISMQISGGLGASSAPKSTAAKELRQPRRSLGLSRVYKQDVDLSQLPSDYWEYFPDATQNTKQAAEKLLARRTARQAGQLSTVGVSAGGVPPAAGQPVTAGQDVAFGAAMPNSQARVNLQVASGMSQLSVSTHHPSLAAPAASQLESQQPNAPPSVQNAAASSDIYAALLQQMQQPSVSNTTPLMAQPANGLNPATQTAPAHTTSNSLMNATAEPVPAGGPEQGLDQGLADEEMDQEGEEPEAVLPPPSPDWEDI